MNEQMNEWIKKWINKSNKKIIKQSINNCVADKNIIGWMNDQTPELHHKEIAIYYL